MLMQDSFNLSFGGSLMDEVMKALTVSESDSSRHASVTDDNHPLLSDGTVAAGNASFDNIAMTDTDSLAPTSDADVTGGSGGVTYAALQNGSGSSLDAVGTQELSSSPPQEADSTLKKKKKAKLRLVSFRFRF